VGLTWSRHQRIRSFLRWGYIASDVLKVIHGYVKNGAITKATAFDFDGSFIEPDGYTVIRFAHPSLAYQALTVHDMRIFNRILSDDEIRALEV
jgi:hypothetical protein